VERTCPGRGTGERSWPLIGTDRSGRGREPIPYARFLHPAGCSPPRARWSRRNGLVPGSAKVPGTREDRLLAMRAPAADGDGERRSDEVAAGSSCGVDREGDPRAMADRNPRWCTVAVCHHFRQSRAGLASAGAIVYDAAARPSHHTPAATLPTAAHSAASAGTQKWPCR
jgi:hypothetical protein